MGSVKEDSYLSVSADLTTGDGTQYEYWVYRSRIIETGEYVVDGHITIPNASKRRYEVRHNIKIKNICSKEMAEGLMKATTDGFRNKTLDYVNTIR